MDLSEILAIGVPVLVALMVAGSIVHAWFAAKKPAPDERLLRPRVIIVCLLHLLIGGYIYWQLYEGGWLTNPYYRWNDPDDINLVLAIFEPLCAVVLVALIAVRKRFFYKLLLDLLIIQLIIAASFVILIVWFALTWQPRMF